MLGRLIAFEGPDTAGKSTVINILKQVLPIIYGTKVKFIFSREPGNTLNGLNNKCEEIRNKLLTDKSLTVEQQAELFAESRYIHTKEIIEYIKKGYVVIVDRYLLSSLVYQGNIIGLEKVVAYNLKSIELLEENNIALNSVIFNIDEETFNKRMSNKKKDAMEDVDYSEAIKRIEQYESFANNVIYAFGKVYSVDATQKLEKVISNTLNCLTNII